MQPRSRGLFATVALCFFISGIAGLVYQVVWSRYLALFLGHTSYAIVAVLVAFMGGLALGNFLFGYWVDRSDRPLAIYAWLEIAIGLLALAFPAYYRWCDAAFLRVGRSLQPGSDTLLLLKFCFSLATILLPTILMGATFPVLTRFVTRSISELRERVAALYAINSAGAVAGCVITDFWIIPNHGLEVALFSASALNLIAGVVAMVLSIRNGEFPTRPEQTLDRLPEEQYSAGELRLALIAIGVSGFVAMLYEVAWTRLLALALGSSTHAFSLMLISFITGIAIGSWVIYLWKKPKRLLLAFGWAEIALAVTLFVSMFFYQYLPFWFAKISTLLARREEAYPIYRLMQAAICFAVMFIPTVCLGMTLPLISRVATRELSQTGRSVGAVFALNTLGTVLGAIVAGLFLMPALGLAKTFAVGIALNALIGLLIVTWRGLAQKRGVLVLPSLAAFAALWFLVGHLDAFWQRAFSMGLWRVPHPPQTAADFRNSAIAMPVVFHKDGAGATVDVHQWKEGGKTFRTLKVNGKADASTQTDMITQLLLGHLPMLLRPESKHQFIIGLGSGMTANAVAKHPSTEQVDVAEISPEVLAAAGFFADANEQVLTNSKVHIVIEDAKSFLRLSDQKYDIIISEPSNPWMAGIASVFSQEYYQTCSTHLKPGGLMAQWMHFYEASDQSVDLVLRTFLSVFPYMSVWQPAMGDLILIGSTQPYSVNLEAMAQRFADSQVRSDLARVDLLTLPTILARELISQQNGLFIIPPEGPIHSDFYPELEYAAQRGFFLNHLADRWRRYREDFSPQINNLLTQYLRQHPLTSDDFNALLRDAQEHRMPEPRVLRSLLLRWQENWLQPNFPIELRAIMAEHAPVSEQRLLRLDPFQTELMERSSTNPAPLRVYATDLMDTYRQQRSIFYAPPTTQLESVLQRLIQTDPMRKRIYQLQLAETAWDKGDMQQCLQLGEAAFNPSQDTGNPVDFSADPIAPRAVLFRMIESHAAAGKLVEAWDLCLQAKMGGYLENIENVFPPLWVTVRRIELQINQARAASTENQSLNGSQVQAKFRPPALLGGENTKPPLQSGPPPKR